MIPSAFNLRRHDTLGRVGSKCRIALGAAFCAVAGMATGAPDLVPGADFEQLLFVKRFTCCPAAIFAR
ncbi:MAG: hypothetical protein NTV46_12475 [Verrucomicrobia bacterium]|nr:hypothetical protein [Verrucomicrobiota bacterium]